MSSVQSPSSAPRGRRERNKQDKLDRIVRAATELFSTRGVEDVTTQEIADRADIGAGTLFLYVSSKGDLLLLVQNALYEDAFRRGRAASEGADGPVDAVMALLAPIIACNRSQVDNGRTYLREIVFGDPLETNHATALDIVRRTEAVAAAALERSGTATATEAAALAHVFTAIVFATVSTAPATQSVSDLTEAVRQQVELVLAGRTAHGPGSIAG